jgi:hypothetical protein
MTLSAHERATVAYLDGIFGPGMGERHLQFLHYLADPALREMIASYHTLETDTEHLSVEENYLLGMAVLCSRGSYETAAMFAKTLLHLKVRKEKVLAAITRLSMWIGGIPAAEAAGHIQRAIRDYEKRGIDSLDAWFPLPKQPGQSG